MSEIVLPTGKVAATHMNPKIFVMYSPPKAGKTTLLSKLDDCCIIDFEGGSKYLSAMKIEVNSLSEFYKTGEAIKKAGKPYKYIAIDTVTKLEDWCETAATNMYKASPIGKSFTGKSCLELPNGAGYFWLRKAFKEWVEYAYTLADYIILVGHLKDKMIEKKGKEVSAKDLDLTGKLKSITCANADAIGYIYREGDKIFVNFKSDDDVTCGSRCDHLKGQQFEFDWKKIYVEEK